MVEQTEAATETAAPAEEAQETSRLSWLVQPAPSPDAPDTRDRGGAQRGMALALAGGAVFWAAVGAAVWLLRR